MRTNNVDFCSTVLRIYCEQLSRVPLRVRRHLANSTSLMLSVDVVDDDDDDDDGYILTVSLTIC